jgi:hypothetical protein
VNSRTGATWRVLRRRNSSSRQRQPSGILLASQVHPPRPGVACAPRAPTSRDARDTPGRLGQLSLYRKIVVVVPDDEDKGQGVPTIPVSQGRRNTRVNFVTVWRPMSPARIEAKWRIWTPNGLQRCVCGVVAGRVRPVSRRTLYHLEVVARDGIEPPTPAFSGKTHQSVTDERH